MTLKLQMLGTGNAFGKAYFNNNALLRLQAYNLLVDCGTTAPMALHRMGIPVGDIDGVLITHLHADHIGGLEELAFQMLFRYRKRIDLYVPALLAQSLWEHSLKAGMECIPENRTGLADFFEVTELEEGLPFAVRPDLTAEIRRTEHIPGMISYSLYLNDVFYSADCRFTESLIREAYEERKVKAILHECQLMPGPGTVHTTLDELLTLPSQSQKIVYLMHYDDDMPEYIGRTGRMRVLEQHKIYEF